jgi:hypothetical protein
MQYLEECGQDSQSILTYIVRSGRVNIVATPSLDEELGQVDMANSDVAFLPAGDYPEERMD